MIKDSALNERATAVEIGGLVDGVGVPVMRAGYALKAKPSWITLSSVEGTGNSQVDVTAPVYKGRNGRSGLITVAVGDLTEDVTLQQEGSTIWDVTTQSLTFVKAGEAKKFTGNSNLASITFAVDSDASDWLTAGKLVVNENEYNSGVEIEGDPGVDDVNQQTTYEIVQAVFVVIVICLVSPAAAKVNEVGDTVKVASPAA